MARHGENIRKRNDGRWEARYQMAAEGKGRKIYRSVYGSTYEEAKEKRIAAMRTAEKSPGSETEHIPDAGGEFCLQVRFSQAAEQWLGEISGKRKHSTYVKYGNIYRLHLEESLGPCLLPGISGPEFQKRISDHLSDKGLSGSIRKSVCCVANQILEFAGRKYSVSVPILKLAAERQAKKLVETFTKSEQSRLLACIYEAPDIFRVSLLLCLYTGMRLGELCALKWEDFDFTDGTVTVNRTVQRIAIQGHMTKTILMETAPKSASSKRTIPLTEEIMGLLRQFITDQPYVFGGSRPLEPRTVQYRFRKILDKAGVGGRNFHILRHTFATNCVESGMDTKTLSVLLGHSDVKTTLNSYVHPTLDSKREQIGRLPDFYGQIRGQAA